MTDALANPLLFTVVVAALVMFVLTLMTLTIAARADAVVSTQLSLRTLESKLAMKNEMLAGLEGKEAIKREEIAELERELEEKRQEVDDSARAEAEADALERRLEELRIEWDQQADRRAELLNLRQETEEAIDSLSRVRAELEEVERELAGRTREAEEASARLAQVRVELEEGEREAEGVRTRLARVSAELEGKEWELGEKTRETEEAIDSLSQVRAKVEEVERELGERTREAEETSARLDWLKEDLKEKEQETAETIKHLAQVSAELAEKQQELEEKTQEAEEARAQLDQVRAEVEEKEWELGEAVKQLGQVRAELPEKQQELDRVKDELKEKEWKLGQVEEELAKQQQKLAHLEGTPGSKDADPLAELRALPPFLGELSKRDERAREGEAEALERVDRYLKSCGLAYPRRVIRAFHTAMKVNESTQMAVLAGISGTGKSQLPRRYAEAMGIGFLQVPVQPRWDSPQDLMGFYNYVSNRFHPTDMARALFHMDQWSEWAESQQERETLHQRMLLILLDEMNLARVEYYFSDFLSRLESRPGRHQSDDNKARTDAEIELDIPVRGGNKDEAKDTAFRIFPGYNLLFAGTMNEDESTQTLSEKVVDRANILRFAAPKSIEALSRHRDAGESRGATPAPGALGLSQWEEWLGKSRSSGRGDVYKDLDDRLTEIIDIMQKLGRPIAHRLYRAMGDYVVHYPDEGALTHRLEVPLADQVEMRLLPKLRGVELDTAEESLKRLRGLVDSKLDDSGLAEAIDASLEASRETGRFVWRGVIRE